MKEYFDEGHGVTVRSLEFWKQHKDLIGKVDSVTGDREHLRSRFEVTENDDNMIPIKLDYFLKIVGEKGAVYLSGCNCGYGGEGPNGTREIMEELGIHTEVAEYMMLQPNFSIDLVK